MPKTETETVKHTPGAIKAAEAITGGKYGEPKRYPTAYGDKTTEGIADIIDRKTAAPKKPAAKRTTMDPIGRQVRRLTYHTAPANFGRALADLRQPGASASERRGSVARGLFDLATRALFLATLIEDAPCSYDPKDWQQAGAEARRRMVGLRELAGFSYPKTGFWTTFQPEPPPSKKAGA